MMEEINGKNKLIREIKDEIQSVPPGEHIFNIFKATLASLPIGASVASLLTDYIPNSKFKRISEFAKQIAEDLKRLSEKVNKDYITKDEFAYMFEQSFRGVAQNYQREKIDALRGILLNSAIRQDVRQEEKEFFLSLVNNLSVLHIRILKFLANPRDYVQEQEIDPNSVQGGFRDIFRTLMPEIDTSIIESAFGDLFQLGLIGTNKTIFNTMTSASGLNLVGDRAEALGRKFIEFCKAP
jgi:hypothetical protein